MMNWFEALRPWNRIALCGSATALVLPAMLGFLTVERIVVTLLWALAMWVCGWALYAMWSGLRNQVSRAWISVPRSASGRWTGE